MNKSSMKPVVFTLVTGAALFGFNRAANATAIMTITDTVGDLSSVTDGGAGDVNSLTGGVTFVGSEGNWNLVVDTGLTQPALGTAADPIDDLSVQASSTTAGSLKIAFSDSSYTASSGSLSATLTGHVVTGASETVTYQVFGNSGNTTGTLNSAGTLSGGGSSLVSFGSTGMPASESASGTLNGLGSAYSLTEVVTVTTTGAGTTSIDAGFTSTVPEPSCLALLGAGVSTLAVRRRRTV
jgi:hypothetical protein